MNNMVEEARKLRLQGFTLTEIAKELRSPKSTVQWWVRNIKLNGKLKKRIRDKILESGKIGRRLAIKVNAKRLDSWKNNIKLEACSYVRKFRKDAGIFRLICGILYLCEGARYPSTRALAFSNSNPRVIKLFLDLFRKSFDVDENKFRARIMHRHDQDGERLEKYWATVTKIPLNQFYQSYSDKRTINSKTKKKDYKGVCAVQYFDTSLQLLLQSIGEALFD